jgi:protein-arginine kinase activator protein McsA
MIEKLKAKIEFHAIRDEYSEADKLREQIQAIQDKPARHEN